LRVVDSTPNGHAAPGAIHIPVLKARADRRHERSVLRVHGDVSRRQQLHAPLERLDATRERRHLRDRLKTDAAELAPADPGFASAWLTVVLQTAVKTIAAAIVANLRIICRPPWRLGSVDRFLTAYSVIRRPGRQLDAYLPESTGSRSVAAGSALIDRRLRRRDLAVPDARPGRLTLANHARLEQLIEVGAADPHPPADVQRRELPGIDPVLQDTRSAHQGLPRGVISHPRRVFSARLTVRCRTRRPRLLTPRRRRLLAFFVRRSRVTSALVDGQSAHRR
jgi:hypothetical protein